MLAIWSKFLLKEYYQTDLHIREIQNRNIWNILSRPIQSRSRNPFRAQLQSHTCISASFRRSVKDRKSLIGSGHGSKETPHAMGRPIGLVPDQMPWCQMKVSAKHQSINGFNCQIVKWMDTFISWAKSLRSKLPWTGPQCSTKCSKSRFRRLSEDFLIERKRENNLWDAKKLTQIHLV